MVREQFMHRECMCQAVHLIVPTIPTPGTTVTVGCCCLRDIVQPLFSHHCSVFFALLAEVCVATVCGCGT